MKLTLNISRMNAADFTETWGYGLLLFAESVRLGLFTDPAPDTAQKAAIVNVSRTWLSKVEAAFPLMKPGDALMMLTMFDFLHRLVRLRPMPTSMSDEYVLRAFNALNRGDNQVNEYELFGFISTGIKHNDPCFRGEPDNWQKSEINRWLDDFNDEKKSGSLPVYDIIQRVTTILRTDLRRFGITYEATVKTSLKRRFSHLIDDLTSTGSDDFGLRTYLALNQFLMEIRGDFKPETFNGYESKIHAAIITSSDIDIYTKTYYEDYLSAYLGIPLAGKIDYSSRN